MAGPGHIYNLIIGWLGKLPVYAERSPLIRHRFQEPVDRDSSTSENGTWSVVPSVLTNMLLPEVERFRFSNVGAFPEEAVFSLLRECLKSGANHSNPLTLTISTFSSYLNLTSVPLRPKGRGLLEVKR